MTKVVDRLICLRIALSATISAVSSEFSATPWGLEIVVVLRTPNEVLFVVKIPKTLESFVAYSNVPCLLMHR